MRAPWRFRRDRLVRDHETQRAVGADDGGLDLLGSGRGGALRQRPAGDLPGRSATSGPGAHRSARPGPTRSSPRSVRSAPWAFAWRSSWSTRPAGVRAGSGRPGTRPWPRASASHAPDIVEPLIDFGPELWPWSRELPAVGRASTDAHLTMARPDDPLLSGWHTVNCLHEWRGRRALGAGRCGRAGPMPRRRSCTTPGSATSATGWPGPAAPLRPRSRGPRGSLTGRGLVIDGEVTDEGIAVRQQIEDDTDRLTPGPWEIGWVRPARSGVRRALRAAVRSGCSPGRCHGRTQLPAGVAGAIAAATRLRFRRRRQKGRNMSDNLRLLGKYSAAMESGDSEAVFKFFTPDFHSHVTEHVSPGKTATTSTVTSKSGGNRRGPRSPT